MKILFVHNKYQLRGGEENVFENEIRLLEEHGHEIDCVIADNSSINSIFTKIRTGLLSFYNPFSSKLIRTKIAAFTPDVIHVHNFFPLISPSVFFRRVRGNVPVVMTIHNYRLVCANAMLFRKNDTCEKCIKKKFPVMGILYKCYRNSVFQTLAIVMMTSIHNLLRTWRKRVDRYICLTEFQKKKILGSSLDLKTDQIKVKPNFVFDEGSQIRRKTPFFLYVGRLNIEKGIDIMIEAFKDTGYKLNIIGEGSYEEYAKQNCKLQDNIEFLGVRDHDFVMGQMRVAKGLIFPSKVFEGFPMVIIEAFSCGMPVIASDIGSQAEIVKDGYNGLHFRMNDPEDLRRKIEILSSTTDNLFNKNARGTFEKYYNEKENYRQLIHIYRELLKSDPN